MQTEMILLMFIKTTNSCVVCLVKDFQDWKNSYKDISPSEFTARGKWSDVVSLSNAATTVYLVNLTVYQVKSSLCIICTACQDPWYDRNMLVVRVE